MIKLCAKELCTGCMACYNTCKHHAISIVKDEEGFEHPSIDVDKCVGCGLCVASCPIHKPIEMHTPSEAIATWASNPQIVRNSSSGGAFTLIANQILDNGGVVFGATFIASEKKVKHIYIESKNDLHRLQGSKYVQSHIGNTYAKCKAFLRDGKTVLFTGTPCQIAGLLTYLQTVKSGNLITLDVICHGVPSPQIFAEYLQHLEQKKKTDVIVDFKFRDKKWSWNRFNSCTVWKNGSKDYEPWEKDAWTRGFLRELFLRPSCHQCQLSRPQRCSDITLGDFWGFKEMRDEKLNHDRGVSMVLLNTDKGKNLFAEIKGLSACYKRDYQMAIENQQALRNCFQPSPLREKFWRDYHSLPFEKLLEKYCYPDALPITKKIKYAIGHWRVYKLILRTIQIINHKIK